MAHSLYIMMVVSKKYAVFLYASRTELVPYPSQIDHRAADFFCLVAALSYRIKKIFRDANGFDRELLSWIGIDCGLTMRRS
jgi:hypothetical protein